MVVALQALQQAGAVDDLGIKALERQKHDGEVGGLRHAKVLLANIFGLALDAGLKNLASSLDRVLLAGFLGIAQPVVGIAGKLGVDGQIDKAVLDGDLDGKFHAVVAAGLGGHVLVVLICGEDVAQDGGKLDLAQDAAGLDVGQHALQAAHVLSHGLHLAQALVDGLELLVYLQKRARQAVV